jgi:hypothetical protein
MRARVRMFVFACWRMFVRVHSCVLACLLTCVYACLRVCVHCWCVCSNAYVGGCTTLLNTSGGGGGAVVLDMTCALRRDAYPADFHARLRGWAAGTVAGVAAESGAPDPVDGGDGGGAGGAVVDAGARVDACARAMEAIAAAPSRTHVCVRAPVLWVLPRRAHGCVCVCGGGGGV